MALRKENIYFAKVRIQGHTYTIYGGGVKGTGPLQPILQECFEDIWPLCGPQYIDPLQECIDRILKQYPGKIIKPLPIDKPIPGVTY